ncbi:MAG: hypothetical protein RIC56_00590 [Pseudomonadales bacterium]
MRRLYYLADELHVCQQVERSLRECGLRDSDFHVVSRDEIGLYQHRIHSATAYQRLDVVPAGERWALTGAAVGALVGLFAMTVQPLAWPIDGLTVLLLILVGALFGAWRGALIGLSRDCYKIARFADDLAAGRHLLMVDVNDRNRSRVRALMSVRFPSVAFCGRDSTLIGPFAADPAR